MVDLCVSMWVEDIQAGNACKAEFLKTAIERLHNTNKLQNIIVDGELFVWRPEIAEYHQNNLRPGGQNCHKKEHPVKVTYRYAVANRRPISDQTQDLNSASGIESRGLVWLEKEISITV